MRRFPLVALLAGAMLLAGSVTGIPAPARAQTEAADNRFGIRLLDVPTDRADDPRARQYIIDHVAPGTSIERRVEVRNHASQPLDISLYAGPAEVSDAQFQVGDQDETNPLTSWSSVVPDTMRLDPGEQRAALVSISLPDDAPGGEHYGVVWAQARNESSGVSTVNRVGVRMYLSVGPGGEPPSDFEIASLVAARDENGDPVVRGQVENTGDRALDLGGELRLDDGPGGLSAGPFPVEVGTTLVPGGTGDALVVLDRSLPDGPWTATMTIRSGTLEKSAQAPITFPVQAARSAPPVPAQSVETAGDSLLRMATAIALGLFVAGGLLLVLLSRRRRRPEEQTARPLAFARRQRPRRSPAGVRHRGRRPPARYRHPSGRVRPRR